jgi:hypothetical protein
MTAYGSAALGAQHNAVTCKTWKMRVMVHLIADVGRR